MENLTLKQGRIDEFIPKSWFKDFSKSQVLIVSYRAVGIDSNNLKNHGWAVSGKRILAFITSSPFKCMVLEPKNIFSNPIEFSYQEKEFNDGPFVHIVTPVVVDGEKVSEFKARSLAKSTSGMLRGIFGKNIAFKKIQSYFMGFEGGRNNIFSPSFENPAFHGSPLLKRETINHAQSVLSAIDKMDKKERNRINLALHWFDKSFGKGGNDDFISLWTALEILAMPSSSDIRPIKAILAKRYSLSNQQVGEKFYLGRIYSIRCKIAHDGWIRGVCSFIILYSQAIFMDIFYEKLGIALPCHVTNSKQRIKDSYGKEIGEILILYLKNGDEE